MTPKHAAPNAVLSIDEQTVTHPNQTSKLARTLTLHAEAHTDPFHSTPQASARLRVENLHYDLTEDDLEVRKTPPPPAPLHLRD